MATPLGDFIRARRDRTRPEDLGLAVGPRRRAPGLRRVELAERAGISVEYLTRIEQGRDRNPSVAIVNALADGLGLPLGERRHLLYLAKITGGACAGQRPAEPVPRQVRPAVRRLLDLIEPGVAFVTNRLGDVLAYTSGFELVVGPLGLLDGDEPNLTRYVFADPRARTAFPDWDHVADERAFDLWLGPSAAVIESFTAALAPHTGPEFTARLGQHLPPPGQLLRLTHPSGTELRWDRETLELSAPDTQQLVVLLPADDATAHALTRLRHSRGQGRGATLHAV